MPREIEEPILALIYDFDKTLTPETMQEREFIPTIKEKTGITPEEFWDKVGELSKNNRADDILMYMYLMLEEANDCGVEVREENFKKFGEKIEFFDGVLEKEGKENWFHRINRYGADSKIKVEHYIISSGLYEMIQGSKISSFFDQDHIFASSFYYDREGIAKWPALAINYTTKTQFLFRINKGCLDVSNQEEINQYQEEHERRIPFRNMIYIGDGDTDIPCFRLVKDRGGYSIAVYKPDTKGEIATKLLEEGRVHQFVKADYGEGQSLDLIVKGIIDKIQVDTHFRNLQEKEIKSLKEMERLQKKKD